MGAEAYGKAYAGGNRGVAVARLAKHRCYGLKKRSELTTLGLCMYRPAVEVKQNARPAKQEEATVPSTPANGRERRRPIVSLDDQANSVRMRWCECELCECRS